MVVEIREKHTQPDLRSPEDLQGKIQADNPFRVGLVDLVLEEKQLNLLH